MFCSIDNKLYLLFFYTIHNNNYHNINLYAEINEEKYNDDYNLYGSHADKKMMMMRWRFKNNNYNNNNKFLGHILNH